LAALVAYTVCEVLETEQLVERAGALGAAILNHFRERLGTLPAVTDIRGKGLMIGIELDRPCGELVGQALARGLLINVTADRVVRLLPPLVMSDEEAVTMVDGVSALIQNFLAAGAPAAGV
jgi:acetylornithine aminotransferase